MPYIKGGDLYGLLRKHRTLPEHIIRFYITQIVIAIGQLHGHGIVHRDLKLENIMLCQNGYLKLIDYGMAKMLEGDTKAQTLAGTSEYMAPEMLAKTRSYDKGIDWWAVGILIFEMLTGKTPFYTSNSR